LYRELVDRFRTEPQPSSVNKMIASPVTDVPIHARRADKRTALGGLLKRKETWTLTWRGRMIALLLMAAFLAIGLWRVHPFLAVNKPVEAEVLVVEGWIPEYALQQCVNEFRSHPYGRIFTTGGPVSGVGSPAADDDTYAYVAASRLRKLGLDERNVQMVPTNATDRDRTYSSAVALRTWLNERGIAPHSINVVTLGAHARRTRLLYEKAFGGHVTVGVIAVEDREYNPERWWRYSEGVREVISEGAAYLYARFLFHPAQ
jgi:uncharacterized SAM-binding protein YcdF (DUF218 family)